MLTVGSIGYGFHRDELYFRMLAPAWGYVDQPPLTPWLARTFTSLVADEAWALRIPATVASAASVVLLGLIARELGGDRRAVAFAAWGAAFAGLPLALGHVLLTSTIDLPLTLAVVLTVLLALRANPRWWLARRGASRAWRPGTGCSCRCCCSGWCSAWPCSGRGRRCAPGGRGSGRPWRRSSAAPNLAYQWQHDWPQLAMGAALAESNAADVRADLPLILLIAIGPPLVVVWLAGAWEAWRQPRARWLLARPSCCWSSPWSPPPSRTTRWSCSRCCTPWAACRCRGGSATTPGACAVVVGLIALNAVVSVVIALPVVPVTALGGTPLPDLSTLVADQVGWPRYVGQVASVAAQSDDPGAVVITSNYGEAGAVARYGPALGLPAPYSGQNELGTRPGPPEGTRTVVFVGWQLDDVSELFATCTVLARLDNGVGVDNEEQGAPVALCRDPVLPWARLWPQLAHLD